MMKLHIASVLAISLAFSSFGASGALAQEAAQFRTVEPRSFSTEDLQRYGLNAEDAAQVRALQEQGYQVRVLTPEEASQYSGGLSNRTWWIIGGIVVVAAIVAASN